MLGKQIGEERGQITAMRVLPTDGPPTIEVSFQAVGHLLDVDVTDMGTYVATARPDGNLAGTGQGVIMTPDGDVATWTGSGVGRPGKGGKASWRGAIYFHSDSPALEQLNGIAVIYEFETDESGKAESKSWEWK
ncbi:MAG TPA: hypothetical protein VGB52_06335 [Actinomycetota bacterium]